FGEAADSQSARHHDPHPEEAAQRHQPHPEECRDWHQPHPEERPQAASRRMGTSTAPVAHPSRRPLRGLLRMRLLVPLRGLLRMRVVLACALAVGGFAAEAAVMAAEPIPSPKPIFFATGSTSGTAGGRVMRGERSLFSVKGTAGQNMTVTLTTPDGNAVFQLYEPGTTIGRDNDGLLEFHGQTLHGAG